MNTDQPKPTTGENDLARETARLISIRWRAGKFREDGGVVDGITPIIQGAINAALADQPKPTASEWTVQSEGETCGIYPRFGTRIVGGLNRKQADYIADSHNAALAAVNEQRDEAIRLLAAERLQHQLDIGEIRRQHQQEADEWTVIGCNDPSDRHLIGQQLAGEREKYRQLEIHLLEEIRQLREQITAEREKVQSLVDALKIVDRWLPRNPMRTDDTRMCEVVRGTLALVKEGTSGG